MERPQLEAAQDGNDNKAPRVHADNLSCTLEASAKEFTQRFLSHAFSELSTPLLCDASARLGIPLRLAPFGIRPLLPGLRVAGRVLPARLYGSVDIFFEAMTDAKRGDVLVIDGGGKTQQACFGDLTALEARACGLAGIVAWDTHRDTAELIQIAFPTFSYGACPAGPQKVYERPSEEPLYAPLEVISSEECSCARIQLASLVEKVPRSFCFIPYRGIFPEKEFHPHWMASTWPQSGPRRIDISCLSTGRCC